VTLRSGTPGASITPAGAARARVAGMLLAALMMGGLARAFADSASPSTPNVAFSGFGTLGEVHSSEGEADFAQDVFDHSGRCGRSGVGQKPDQRPDQAPGGGSLPGKGKPLSEWDSGGAHRPAWSTTASKPYFDRRVPRNVDVLVEAYSASSSARDNAAFRSPASCGLGPRH
jgi:hypothetical protein